MSFSCCHYQKSWLRFVRITLSRLVFNAIRIDEGRSLASRSVMNIVMNIVKLSF